MWRISTLLVVMVGEVYKVVVGEDSDKVLVVDWEKYEATAVRIYYYCLL